MQQDVALQLSESDVKKFYLTYPDMMFRLRAETRCSPELVCTSSHSQRGSSGSSLRLLSLVWHCHALQHQGRTEAKPQSRV